MHCIGIILLINTVLLQLRNNPAALLALCWYWASEGVGSKVRVPFKCWHYTSYQKFKTSYENSIFFLLVLACLLSAGHGCASIQGQPIAIQ